MKLNIVKHKFIYLAISAILLLPGIIAMIYSMFTYDTHTPVKVGIDYTGGTTLQYGIKEEITNNKLTEVRSNLEEAGIEKPILQIINVNSKDTTDLKAILSIRTKFIDEESADLDKTTNVMNSVFQQPELVQVTSVGPTLGKELFKNSMIALSLALLGIVAYLTFRFQFDYALAAILGLVHDTIFVVGVFSILGLFYGVQIDALFVTALLTVIGFSVHDTIVTFDRVRENLKYYSKKMTFGEIMNASVNQTLTRSINTSVTTLITLAALYFFGGVTTKDFVLAMILGIAIGTYSSIFFCSSLIEIWEDKKI
ncbi:MAG: protein translocase subunit SecF [Cyanobacteria bacterium SIG28]|nr:protein translocase subunit SecF [Cyanobacteria bacterium SIG28]